MLLACSSIWPLDGTAMTSVLAIRCFFIGMLSRVHSEEHGNRTGELVAVENHLLVEFYVSACSLPPYIHLYVHNILFTQ